MKERQRMKSSGKCMKYPLIITLSRRENLVKKLFTQCTLFILKSMKIIIT